MVSRTPTISSCPSRHTSRPLRNTISGFPSGTLCMGTTDGSVYFSMTKSGIDIKGNVTITGNLTTTGGVVNLN